MTARTDGETRHCGGCRGFTRDWETGCPGLTLEDVLMACARTAPHPGGRPASLASDFTATLRARDANPGLLWRELIAGRPGGPYWQDWYCEPPRSGTVFRVPPGREEWITEDDIPVRRIYETEVTDAAAEERPRAADRDGPAGPGPAQPGTSGPAEAAPVPERPDRESGDP